MAAASFSCFFVFLARLRLLFGKHHHLLDDLRYPLLRASESPVILPYGNNSLENARIFKVVLIKNV